MKPRSGGAFFHGAWTGRGTKLRAMKTALITGATSGVAQALARELLGQGWKLSLACRDESRLDPALGQVQRADVSTEVGANDAVAAATEWFRRPASRRDQLRRQHPDRADLHAPAKRSIARCCSANLDTAFFVGKAYATALSAARQGGALVFFSSVVAGIGVSNHAAIAAAKGGVEALTRSLAADFSGIGLRVNCIAPGLMRTPMTERMLGNEAAARQIAAQYPLGRHGEAEDAAALGRVPGPSGAGWITGQVIGLDGGFSAVRPYVKAG